MNTHLKSAILGGASLLTFAAGAQAHQFNIPAGDLASALSQFTAETGVDLIVSEAAIKGARTQGLKGEAATDVALTRILSGTGFTQQREDNAIAIVKEAPRARADEATQTEPLRLAAASSAGVETVVVTSSKIKGDIQTVPIAITALSQEQLTSRQIAGGPDLVKEVPNLTFSKTNFTGYNIQIRGIGTQAISVETDPAVAVSFNDIPFLRNHFFEQEFYDVGQVEVLRGPQGTLYGRNAPAGVVNVISAKPTDHFEAKLSADWGNYTNRRYEGMVNVPVLGDKIDLRVAGEWTKRDGYTYNQQTGSQIDGRDLWSSRVSLLVHPTNRLTATAIWEHFQETDDRLRSGKQLCAEDPGPAVVDGPAGPLVPGTNTVFGDNNYGAIFLTQGCLPASLYSSQSFETPNGFAIPFIQVLPVLTRYSNISFGQPFEPYESQTQSRNLRVIDSSIDPQYRAKNETFEFNADYNLTSSLTLTSQTGYNKDYLFSTEDYNRFSTKPGLFRDPGNQTFVGQDGLFCDPQLGCSSRLIAQDISEEHSRQFYQEVRLTSDFKGPLNFVVGGNFMKYWTSENYYVFANTLSLIAEHMNQLPFWGGTFQTDAPTKPFDVASADSCPVQPAVAGVVVTQISLFPGIGCSYVDPHPLDQVDGQGHNYFLSKNPYQLTSWAGFGEVNYQIAPDVKLTGGLRYTDDKKVFDEYPSWALLPGKGIPLAFILKQRWQKFTGRAVVDWTPKLDFTDQSLIYASYAHGYKAGGANPPGVTTFTVLNKPYTSPSVTTHPLTFKPEFNDAFEVGTKNTLLDGALTLNGDVFFYKYQGYQISQIVDRTSVNLNFNATVRGAELETTWSPIPGLKLGFNGGYENATLDNGQSAIDLMDRTDGNPNWLVVKPYVTMTSNCVLPTYEVNASLAEQGHTLAFDCTSAYAQGFDPVTVRPYVPNPPITMGFPAGYPGFDPLAGNDPNDPYTGQNTYNGVDYGPAPNNGEGFAKNVGGNQMPNAPHFTTSLTADFTMPVSDDWAATLHGDFYWQSQSMARVFNDRPYDKLRGYSNVNLALILTDADGWQVMGYVKNVFDTTAITGAFLNSDDSGLTTNIFTTDPRLYGIRVTKTFD